MQSDLIKLIPKELLHTSGSVFYSGKTAWEGQKPLYVIGLNPGGDIFRQASQTIIYHTSKNRIKEKENWSEYRDENWNGKEAGTAPFQRRILHLFSDLGLDPADIPASNLIFKRSRSESELSNEFNYLAELCWPFHANVIEKLGVKLIVCLGKKSGFFVKHKLKASKLIDIYTEDNKRKWKTWVYQNKNDIKIVITPHPSWANWLNPKSDPSVLIKKHFCFISK